MQDSWWEPVEDLKEKSYVDSSTTELNSFIHRPDAISDWRVQFRCIADPTDFQRSFDKAEDAERALKAHDHDFVMILLSMVVDQVTEE